MSTSENYSYDQIATPATPKVQPVAEAPVSETPLSYNQTSVVSVEHNFKQIVGSVMSVEQRLLNSN
ncbi:hypothetical protein [Phocaeicola coprocola]|uniref:hypothetical protein n=1 Tax=Phocaeicola coprocola TaxID=310298 RepID=UPI003FD87C36